MEAKDQRLEIRISQQQVSDLDEIISSLDTHFKPTRSDVVRSFISQGIERHYGRGPKEESTVPLIQRLSLYFQFCQTERLQRLSEHRPVSPLGHWHKQKFNSLPMQITSNITADYLVRKAYLQKLNWFFELDEKSLRSVDELLSGEDVLMLMAPEPSTVACTTLAEVLSVRFMFRTIEAAINDAQDKVDNYGYTDIRDKLVIIRDYAESKAIPLKFQGYPDTRAWKLHAEMRALLDWIDRGEGGLPVLYFINHSSQDVAATYTLMLDVFSDVCEGGYLSLDSLVAMVKDRRL